MVGDGGRRVSFTSEHVLSLAIENTCPRLKRLAAEEFGQGDSDGVRGTRHNRLGLAWTSALVLVLVLMLAFTTLLGGHPGFLLLLLDVLDELGNCHAGLLRIRGELALHHGQLLGRYLGHLPSWRTLHCADW